MLGQGVVKQFSGVDFSSYIFWLKFEFQGVLVMSNFPKFSRILFGCNWGGGSSFSCVDFFGGGRVV